MNKLQADAEDFLLLQALRHLTQTLLVIVYVHYLHQILVLADYLITLLRRTCQIWPNLDVALKAWSCI